MWVFLLIVSKKVLQTTLQELRTTFDIEAWVLRP